MTAETCGSCRYYSAGPPRDGYEGEWGWCYRYPPQASREPDPVHFDSRTRARTITVSNYPPLPADTRACGEYAPIPGQEPCGCTHYTCKADNWACSECGKPYVPPEAAGSRDNPHGVAIVPLDSDQTPEEEG